MPLDADEIQPVVTKFPLGEQPNDVAYWLSQPPAARIAELERIRREYILAGGTVLTRDFREFFESLNAEGVHRACLR